MGFQISVVHAVLQEQFVSKESIITFKCIFKSIIVINIITANGKFIYTFLFYSFSAKK